MATSPKPKSSNQGRALSKLFRLAHKSSPRVSRPSSAPPPQTQLPERIQNDDHNGGAKRTSSSKTRRARDLAGIINRKPWSDGLEHLLSPCPPLSKTTVKQTLQLIANPLKALQFFNWVRSNGFSVDSQCLFSVVEILSRGRCLNVARNLLFSIAKRRPSEGSSLRLEARFFNSLISGYGRAGLIRESIKMFSTMKSLGVSPTTVTFNTLFSILLKRSRTVMAHQLYDEMLKTFGVSPDVFTFNILIRGFCKNSMVDEGFRIFNEMSRFHCNPDVVTYNTLVDGLCQDGRVEVARNLVIGMAKKGAVDSAPNVVTYTTLIRGYCEKKNVNEALNVLEEMVQRMVKPNRITYNILIQGLCEAGRLDKVKDLLARTSGDGEIAPDTCTMNTLMTAYCNLGKLKDAVSLFRQLSDLQLNPDSASYSVLIRGLCQREDFEEAEELFDELSEKEILVQEEGCKPLVAAYNPMFSYLCANGKTKKAEKVFRQLMRRGVQDPQSYKTLIVGHCTEGTFVSGYDLLVLMLRRDYKPDFETYETLINGSLNKASNAILAHKTLEMMLKSSHRPKAHIYHSVLSGLVKQGIASESAALIELMLENEIRQNVNLSTGTLILLFKSGKRDEAFKTLGLLHENGYSVKLEEIVRFLCNKKKLLDACEMLVFSLEKDVKVDIGMHDEVISGLCKARRMSEAFDLYFKLVNKGGNEQLNCVEDLKNSLISSGKSKEAEFVSKRMPKQDACVIRRKKSQ